MLIRTHLSITLFFVLVLVSKVEHKFIFVLVALVATFIPDVDSRYSTLGRKKINRILQLFTKHRGITHSFIFLIAVTLVLLLFVPIIALGFFLGYGLHLLADSFTKDGIKPFHPFYKGKSRGKISTGGKVETIILVCFLIADLFLMITKIVGLL